MKKNFLAVAMDEVEKIFDERYYIVTWGDDDIAIGEEDFFELSMLEDEYNSLDKALRSYPRKRNHKNPRTRKNSFKRAVKAGKGFYVKHSKKSNKTIKIASYKGKKKLYRRARIVA